MFRKYIILFSTIMLSLLAYGQHNGLHFNSHSFTPAKRTTLNLNDGERIEITDNFSMSFNLDLRNEASFGNIFCVKTDDGHHIDAIFSVADDKASKPSIAIDGKFHYINHNVEIGEKNVAMKLDIDRNKGIVRLWYNKKSIEVKADLKNTFSATIAFGMHTDESNYNDVAPMNVRNIAISNNGKRRYFWTLSNHYGDLCQDSISGMKARAINGNWMYDSHVKLNQIYNYQSNDIIMSTFNPEDGKMYIVEDNHVLTFDTETKKTNSVKVNGGYRVIDCSNHLIYDNTSGRLFNYALAEKRTSNFDLTTGMWSFDKEIEFTPAHTNHAWARANDSISYAFGGYGFYRYKNNLYRINQRSGEITEVNYSPKVKPRTGSAAAYVDGKVYIFGGYGNESGKQELPGNYYYDLVCIDLKTNKASTVWVGKGEQETSFQLASEMYYDKDKRCFYAATTHQGGRIIRIFIDEPAWEIVTDGIGTRFEFKELTFDLYKSEKQNKMFVVTNKWKNNDKHELTVFSIDMPLQDNYQADLDKWQQSEKKTSPWWWLMLPVILAIAIAALLYTHMKNRKAKMAEMPASTPQEQPVTTPSAPLTIGDATITDDYTGEDEVAEVKERPLLPGQITLLGKFAITDKEGNDITSNFSKRLRDLLLIIILNTQKNNKGVEMREIDDNMWQNMSEVSARNNRNVNISKLRMLVEKVGDIEIINDKTYYQIRLGNDVSCDYTKAMKYMARVNNGYNDDRTIARTLELLLKGPLVPNVSYEWLDPFKAKYSESALALLSSLLRRAERDSNDALALKIAETIMQHDPFNDKALEVQCTIHCNHNRKGIAKKVYDNFCKVYQNSMGEPYNRTFMEVCK